MCCQQPAGTLTSVCRGAPLHNDFFAGRSLPRAQEYGLSALSCLHGRSAHPLRAGYLYCSCTKYTIFIIVSVCLRHGASWVNGEHRLTARLARTEGKGKLKAVGMVSGIAMPAVVHSYEHQTRCPILPFFPDGYVGVTSTSINQRVWSVPNVILVGLLLDVGSGK